MRRRPLGSTYRLQLFRVGFDGARRLVASLHRLGVETLYVSPVLMAAPGSTHGYDVVDPTHLDPVLGDDDDFEALLAALAEHGMRLLVDIVPNHLAVSAANPWWQEVLRGGRAAESAAIFDIDWAAGDGRVVLPVLGRPVGEVLAAGELTVEIGHGADGDRADGDRADPCLAYFGQRFPLDPASVPAAPYAAGRARAAAGTRPQGDAAALLGRQHYRLAYWRAGRQIGNYRRFFDVDTLVGVRLEDPAVYARTHRRLLELAADGRLAGLRVDHVDGLADPARYLAELRRDLVARRPADPPVVLVEKILARGETVPAHWATDGTTGYEFADLAGGLLIDAAGAARMSGDADVPAVRATAKRDVLSALFPGQLRRLADQAVDALAAGDPADDLAAADMGAAIGELTAQFDVYRTYVDDDGASAADRARVTDAAGRARPRLDAEGRRALDRFCEGVLERAAGGGPGAAGTPASGGPAVAAARWLSVARRWQQLTGAVAAKGVEDTAAYRWTGNLAAAEVGGDPGQPAVDAARFHAAMRRRRSAPSSLNATSTHDTKRSEDVRARLAVLTECPERWESLVARWRRAHRSLVGADGPDALDEAFVYQTVVGAWPLDRGRRAALARRVAAYSVKAAREAKRRTSWLEPDERYERALQRFVRSLLSPANQRFTRDVESLLADIGPAGAVNSLVQLVLKATAPGVPDLYQGTEDWSLTLVDPDNRQPVDAGALGRRLAALERDRPGAAELLATWPDGRVKLSVTAGLLRWRRAQPTLFDRGAYVPLEVRGRRAAHVVAFARHRGRRWSVTVVPRLVLGLGPAGAWPLGAAIWRGTTVALPDAAPDRLTDVLRGAPVDRRGGGLPVSAVLAALPVAVLGGD